MSDRISQWMYSNNLASKGINSVNSPEHPYWCQKDIMTDASRLLMMSMASGDAGLQQTNILHRSISTMTNNTDLIADSLPALLAPPSTLNFQGIKDAVVPVARNKRARSSIVETSDETGEEDLGADIDYSYQVGKKKRLSLEQVKALEKNFALENKLEPERKSQLAQELRLHPRQVAVWFQNRRARWKTKQLEKDYDILKREYGKLRADFDALLKQKGKLENQVMELNGKLLHQPDEKLVSHLLDGKGMHWFKKPQASIKLQKEVESETVNVLNDSSVLQPIGKMRPHESVCSTAITDVEIKEVASTSDSDDSEILDMASTQLQSGGKNPLPPEPGQHHIASEILLLGGCNYVGSLSLFGEDGVPDRVNLPHIYQVHAMQQEDVTDKEANIGHTFLTIGDQVGAFSHWEWP